MLLVTLKPLSFYIGRNYFRINDLMNADFGSYGEENKGWTAEEAKGFIKIYGNQSKIYQNVNAK